MTASAREQARVAAERAKRDALRREFDRFMEERHQQITPVSGVDLADDGTRCHLSLTDRARTTDGWASAVRLPVQWGRVRRLKYVEGDWLAFVVWDRPSLFADDCWFPARDLEVAGG